MYKSGCAFSSRTNFMWERLGAIDLFASCDIFVKRPPCYVINQQQLQWAASQSS